MDLQCVGVGSESNTKSNKPGQPVFFRRRHASPLERYHASAPLKLAKRKGAPLKLSGAGVQKHQELNIDHHKSRLALQPELQQNTSKVPGAAVPPLLETAIQLLQQPQQKHDTTTQLQDGEQLEATAATAATVEPSAALCTSDSTDAQFPIGAVVSLLCALQQQQKQRASTTEGAVHQVGLHPLQHPLPEAETSDSSCQSDLQRSGDSPRHAAEAAPTLSHTATPLWGLLKQAHRVSPALALQLEQQLVRSLQIAAAAAEATGRPFDHATAVQHTLPVLQAAVDKAHQGMARYKHAVEAAVTCLAQQHRLEVVATAAEAAQGIAAAVSAGIAANPPAPAVPALRHADAIAPAAAAAAYRSPKRKWGDDLDDDTRRKLACCAVAFLHAQQQPQQQQYP